ncbi:MAG: alpha/beta hydrolase [Planctomycetes bacterium]|nr:alpha/beta hydrolase [Planctomycetota bacterium]
MIPPEELELQLPSLRLAARAWGPPDGHRVLALHGWQDNAATFDLLVPRLGDGLRVVALDLTGHGLSDHRPEGVGYTFLDWVIDAHAAIDALGWDRCSILGHSLGVGIGNALAATWPERVDLVAGIDGFAPRTDEPWMAPTRLAECVQSRTHLRSRPARVLPDIEAAAARLCERIRGLPIEGARILAARGTKTIDGGVTWRRDPIIQAGPPLRLDDAQIDAFLGAIRCPVLLVRPRGGWPVDDDVIERLQHSIQDLRIELIDGGHHVHLEHPDVVAGIVRPFFESPA